MKSNIILENKFFNGASKNLTICISDDKTELIKNILDSNKCMFISCKGNLPNYEYRLNTENECFTENCSFTI